MPSIDEELALEIERVKNEFLPKAPNGMIWLIARKAVKEAEEALSFHDEGRQNFYLKLLRRYVVI